MLNLEGKTALVTGGSRGIGAAIAKKFSEVGMRVAFTYKQDRRSANRVASELTFYGSHCLVIRADVRSRSDVKRAVSAVLDHFGHLDVLVNNAGIWKRGPIEKMRVEEWEETLDTNLTGAFLFCNAVVPHMKKRKEGKIINIASTAGQRGEAYYSHYAASKGGMIAFTKSIAVELAPYNVIANCISPGWVETDMTVHVLRRKRELREIQNLIPRGRVGTADEVAGAALFLASDLSSHIVGAVINVNGGSVLFG